ncbi:COMM domain-containing protein 10 [Aphanomyces cochlioides]|nr:COMM domain-containing protein 10 [Aphanomyces cochlioides]
MRSSTSLVDNANAVPLINAFPQDKLSHLVRRILQAPHETNGGFKSEEQQQLMEMGHMSPVQMQSFIGTLEHTFARAGSVDWDDRQVLDSLTSTGINDKVANIIASAWAQERASYRAMLLEQSTTYQLPNVTESHWRMHVTIADSKSTGQAIPTALFNLRTNDNSECHMEMNHSELLQFLIQLDAIQAQLDTLAP